MSISRCFASRPSAPHPLNRFQLARFYIALLRALRLQRPRSLGGAPPPCTGTDAGAAMD